ncbi:A24 family peptidase [Georgenia wangjunii]|uniref:A24 family peptidase n=1 Tax=Georgenia wangjunii TaxID=3117730 RepID=UPI002F26B290
MTPAVVLLTAVATAVAAVALTPWMRRVTTSDSAWLRSGVHVVLAALGGAGAAGLASGWAEMITFATLAVACALLVPIDLAEYRLPDIIVGPMYPVLLVGLAVAAAAGGEWGSLGRAVGGAVVLGVGYLVLALITPSGLGLGDVKLAGLLGAFLGWLGWSHVLLGTLAAFVLGGVVALVLLVTRRAQRHSSVAFGPWMIVGAAVGAAWGPGLIG